MCHNCDYSKSVGVGYKVNYHCQKQNNEITEISDTYFNKNDRIERHCNGCLYKYNEEN